MALLTGLFQAKDIKVGDTFNNKPSDCGQYVNCIITEIKTTKSGRLNIYYSSQFLHNNVLGSVQIACLTNGAKSPETYFEWSNKI